MIYLNVFMQNRGSFPASEAWLINENLEILSFWRTFFGMIANVVLNLILIPKYGIMGSALATLASQFIAAFMFDLLHRETKRIFF